MGFELDFEENGQDFDRQVEREGEDVIGRRDIVGGKYKVFLGCSEYIGLVGVISVYGRIG